MAPMGKVAARSLGVTLLAAPVVAGVASSEITGRWAKTNKAEIDQLRAKYDAKLATLSGKAAVEYADTNYRPGFGSGSTGPASMALAGTTVFGGLGLVVSMSAALPYAFAGEPLSWMLRSGLSASAALVAVGVAGLTAGANAFPGDRKPAR